ncbi:molecular chaperone TorD family protein [Raoultibacter timonensis]|uniref:Nitrate reductase delta subunit n=1 Tax=Raoultibacter timonensis TaxID=1907662 RepID=A0ABN6MHQ2_9ACTN|nr:molecular chaperone TorD family protein [Raoultibacter timonensis]BDE97532.1 hypothetical protein CE91St30_28650 [Raoultibacter timonensis]BDF52135.1 hypothetical protein CE91St31_28650 [Raoultibacter timonensis]
MQNASFIVNVIASVAIMFTRQSEERYRETCRSEAWALAREAGKLYLGDVRKEGLRPLAMLEPPTWEVRRAVQNEVLTAGMPFSALPVESLYRPWSAARGSNYGAQRGLYLGDAAHHVQSIYDRLGIEVPEAFAASPDHLALLLELVALFIESGNDEAACSVATDHFGWLGAYDEALETRAEKAAAARLFDDEKKAAVCEGVAHLRALVALTGELALAVARPGAAGFEQGRVRGASCLQPSDQQEHLAVCGDVR